MGLAGAFIPFVAAVVFSSLALRQPRSTLRMFYTCPFLTLSWHCWLRIPKLSSSHALESALSLFILVWTLHILALVMIERTSLLVDGQTPTSAEISHLIFDFRRIGQKSLRNHRQAARDGKRGTKLSAKLPPSRLPFVASRGRRLVLCGAVWYIYETRAIDTVSSLFHQIDSLDQQLPVTSVRALRAFILNTFMVAEFIGSTYMVNNFFHSLFAIFAVGVFRTDSSEDWPLIWGNLRATTSVRAFWAGFWHRLIARTFISWASVPLSMMKVQRGSAAERHLLAIMVFVLSGVCHGATTWLMGFRCGWWVDVAWFIMQAIAIIVEDAFAQVWKGVRKHGLRWTIIARMAGFTWTWVFVAITIGWLQSTRLACMS